MKITKSQLKEIIKEEASRLKKQYILEDKKKAITEELRMLNEEEELDMSDINDMSIEDKAVFSAMNDEEVEDDLSDVIAKYTKQGGDYEGGYKDDVSVSPGYLSEMSADGDVARYENAYEKLIGRPGSEEEGRFLSAFNPQERIIDILKSAYINNGNSYFYPADVSFIIMQMLKK